MRLLALALGLAVWLTGPATAQEARVALVIGVAHYSDPEVHALANTLNDSQAIARALRDRGFQVRELTDPTRRDIMSALNAFTAELPKARVALFYFSGHGVQLGGANYLVPRDLTLPHGGAVAAQLQDLQDQSVNVADIAARMTAANAEAFHLLILDACRGDPFAAAYKALVRVGGLAAPFGERGDDPAGGRLQPVGARPPGR